MNTVLPFRQAVSLQLVAFSFDDLQPGTELLIFSENNCPSIITLSGQLACGVCMSKLGSLVRGRSGSVAERELPAHSGFQGPRWPPSLSAGPSELTLADDGSDTLSW